MGKQIYYRLRSILEFKINSYMLGLLVFACFFLRPYPQAYLGASAMRVIDMVMLGLPIIYFMVANVQLKIDKRLLAIIIFYCAIFLFGLLSLANGYLLGATMFSFRDPLDVIRYLQFPVFILFGYFLTFNPNYSSKDFLLLILLIFFAIVLFAILQKVVPARTGFLTNLYAPSHQGSRVLTTGRVTTLFGNPNTTALMICLFSSFFFGLRINKGDRILRPWQVYLLIGVSLFTVLLSGSRSGLIAFAFLFLIYIYCRAKYKLIFYLGLPVLLGLVWSFQNQILELIKYFNAYLYVGIKLVLSLDLETLMAEGNTFSARFSRWIEAFNLFKTSPVFGLGPLRGVVTSSTDNFYIYLLLRNGVVGLVLYFALTAYGLYLSAKARKASGYLKLVGYAYLFQTCIILFMNFLIEAQIINSPAYLHLTTLGVLLGLLKLEKNNGRQNT